jgi:hypothetical protein
MVWSVFNAMGKRSSYDPIIFFNNLKLPIVVNISIILLLLKVIKGGRLPVFKLLANGWGAIFMDFKYALG